MEGMGSLKIEKSVITEDLRSASRVHQGDGPSLEAGKKVENAQSQPPKKVEVRDLKAMALELEKALKDIDNKFSVSIDDRTGILVVRIKDPITGEIVKQVPTQQLLDSDANMDKIIGLLVDDMA